MNIFEGLKQYPFPYFPIFDFWGWEIKDAIFKSWGASCTPDPFLFPKRLETITSIVKAKALRYRFETKNGERLKFEDLIDELCSADKELAEETAAVLNKAVRLETAIEEFRKKYNFQVKIEFKDEDIDEIVSGPVYYGFSYDNFISSAVDFQSEDLNEIFLNEYLIDFERPIYFNEDNETHKNVVDENLEYLNQMHIYKSKTLDMLKTPRGGFFLCVDVNKRFKNGDCISTDSAWVFGQACRNLEVVIIN